MTAFESDFSTTGGFIFMLLARFLGIFFKFFAHFGSKKAQDVTKMSNFTKMSSFSKNCKKSGLF